VYYKNRKPEAELKADEAMFFPKYLVYVEIPK